MPPMTAYMAASAMKRAPMWAGARPTALYTPISLKRS